MSLISQITDLITRIGTEFKSVQTALSGRVPYTGANANLDLGVYSLIAKVSKIQDAVGTSSYVQMSTGVANPRRMVYVGSTSGNSISNAGVRICPDPAITSQKPIFLELKTNNADSGTFRTFILVNTSVVKFVTSSGDGTGVGAVLDITTRGENYTVAGIKMDNTAEQKVGLSLTPTARLHLPAGQASANNGPLKFTSGTLVTNPEAGLMEFDGSRLYFTPAAARKTIAFTDDAPPNASITYAKLSSQLTSKATVTSTVDLSANGIGSRTLSANTAFTFTNFQLNKVYLLIITANGYTPSWAQSSKHVAVTGNETLGTSGVFYVTLTCIDDTSGSEKLLTMIMKGA